MQAFTYSEARQNFAKLLILAQTEEVEIRRKDGALFSLTSKLKRTTSPLDVPGIKTDISTQDILDAISKSRAGRYSE